MADKILGIDLGTNSIGWAICKNLGEQYVLQDAGSLIFQEGVGREKGIEIPAVKKRTEARASRRHYFRRRLLKIELLKVLIENDMCPKISDEELKLWRFKKVYPTDPAFLEWQRTNGDDNPYFARHEALTRTLDLSDPKERYLLGRALYHLAQRRGFLSNRKDIPEGADGTVKTAISELSKEIDESGSIYLGEYFYRLYLENRKIRTRYTDRLQHTEKEFKAICKKQNLPESLVNALYRAIFYQRPLKSQKGLVGKCIFETNKSRCPLSHPSYEEYRMLAFINNIKIAEAPYTEYRSLYDEERRQIIPLFYRKKDSFDFEDIAKKIAGKGNYSFRDDKTHTAFKFNFRMSTSVSGCPLTAGLRSLFGEDWEDTICSTYLRAENKSRQSIINDVWHALYYFSSDDKLAKWAIDNLQLPPEQATAFTKIKVQQGYASLSLKAINKILPFLREGMRYDEAVFVANLDAVLPADIKADPVQKSDIVDHIATLISQYKDNPLSKSYTKEQLVRRELEDVPAIDLNRLSRIYHPSKLNIYPDAEINDEGFLLLGSPRTSSVRNPMAMRALFQLRHLINRLLLEGRIDRTTRINIEFARGLNDSNMRKAIEQDQREKKKLHDKYSDEIRKLYKESTGADIEPTATDILKYQFWIEQDHHCLYTGEQIAITDFIGPNPKYDIEHTIPRSLGGDDSQANKTLCNSAYNRQIKRATLPALLTNHEVIMARINSLGWLKKVDDLSNMIARIKTTSASTKEIKDNLIQKRHRYKMLRDYWREKIRRFTMTEVPDGFSNRQGVDIGIIGKYAREYLKTLFKSEEHQIFTVKGLTTAEFRKMWGLQPEFEKKERINHTHHMIDAITIACIGRRQYQLWAEYLRRADDHHLYGGEKPKFEKPWPTFTEDVKRLTEEILVVHTTSDSTLKPSRKILRHRCKKQVNAEGNYKYQQGDTARAQLHNDTFYGAINRDGEIIYVLRKKLGDLSEADVAKIVDPVVQKKIQDAIDERGFKHLLDSPIWMNEAKGIEIKKVRVRTPSVSNPLHIKSHRDQSKHTYKQTYHVANDSNYCMAIYEGINDKKKVKRSYLIINNIDAVTKKKAGEALYPLSDNDGMPLKWVLKIGTMVLFYEKSPEELFVATPKELAKRLYKVTGLTTNPVGKGYGSINLRFHQEARPSTDPLAKSKNGSWSQGEEIRPGIIMLHTQFNALVQNQDFTISESGKIEFIHRLC